MKRIKRLVFIILLFIPFIVYGKVTYNENEIKNITNNYTTKISKEYNLEYGKYFDSDIDDLKIITKEEFETTKKGKGVSYLISSLEYWAKDKYKISYSATQVTNDNDKSGVRVTEYAKSDIKASGEGTLSSPWVLENETISINVYREESVSDIIFSENKEPFENKTNIEKYVGKDREWSFYYKLDDNGYRPDISCSPTPTKSEVNVGENKITIQSNEDVRCFIKKIPNQVVVTFNSKGGTTPTPNESKTVTIKEKYGDLSTTKKTGYNFVGWNDKEDYSGNTITKDSTVSITQNHTLYAMWDGIEINVTYDKNATDATIDFTSGKQKYGSNYNNLPTPQRTGYNFIGWFTEKDGGTQVTTSTKVTITSDHTIYAHWTAMKCNVTFDPNGENATVSPTIIEQTYNQNYILPNNSNVKNGKMYFQGWYTSPTGGIKITSGTRMTNINDHTLYAHWTAVSNCDITWNTLKKMSASVDHCQIDSDRKTERNTIGVSNSFDGSGCKSIKVRLSYESEFDCHEPGGGVSTVQGCWGGQYFNFNISLINNNDGTLISSTPEMTQWEEETRGNQIGNVYERTFEFPDNADLSNVRLEINAALNNSGEGRNCDRNGIIYHQYYGFFEVESAPSGGWRTNRVDSSHIIKYGKGKWGSYTGWFITDNNKNPFTIIKRQ